MRLIVLLAGIAMIVLGVLFLVNSSGTNADWLAGAAIAGGVGLFALHGPRPKDRWDWRHPQSILRH